MHKKTQQGTEKAREHNWRTVFLRYLIFSMHQYKWCSFCFIFYPLFIFLSQNLLQPPFLPSHLPPLEHTAAILDRVSIPPVGNRVRVRRVCRCCRCCCRSCTQDNSFVGHLLAGDRRRIRCLGMNVDVLPGVGHRRKFLIPLYYPFFPTYPLSTISP